MSEYVPTTEEIIRGFSAPAYKVEPRREGEGFAEWLSRLSVDSFHAQVQSEAAARRWLAAHDRQVKAEALRAFAALIEEIANLGSNNTGLRTPKHLAEYTKAYANRIERGEDL